jgi:hypothetical protein
MESRSPNVPVQLGILSYPSSIAHTCFWLVVMCKYLTVDLRVKIEEFRWAALVLNLFLQTKLLGGSCHCFLPF